MTEISGSPLVSIVMPCLNEARFIQKSIESLCDEFCMKNCELLIADGVSRDGTIEIIHSLIKKKYPIKLLENRMKLQVYGLNLAIQKATGEIIIRADTHCIYPSGYVKKCVDLLEKTGAANVGGVMVPQGKSLVQNAIALAMQHPLGVGDAKFHLGNYTGFVDTVYLGTFRKETFDKVGLFDTNCITNEDAELNLRITKAGGKIYLDDSLKVLYFPRESLKELIRQYFRYGRGRCYTTLKHRKITSWRQIAPVLLIIGLLSSIILGFWQPWLFLVPLLYMLFAFLASLFSWRRKRVGFKKRLLLGTAILCMHTSWGSGFIYNLLFFRHHRKRDQGNE